MPVILTVQSELDKRINQSAGGEVKSKQRAGKLLIQRNKHFHSIKIFLTYYKGKDERLSAIVQTIAKIASAEVLQVYP